MTAGTTEAARERTQALPITRMRITLLYWYVRDGSGGWGSEYDSGHDDGYLSDGKDFHLKIVADGDDYHAYIGEYGSGQADKHLTSYYNDTSYKGDDKGHIALYDYSG